MNVSEEFIYRKDFLKRSQVKAIQDDFSSFKLSGVDLRKLGADPYTKMG